MPESDIRNCLKEPSVACIDQLWMKMLKLANRTASLLTPRGHQRSKLSIYELFRAWPLKIGCRICNITATSWKRKQPRHAKMTSEKTWKKKATTTCKDDVRKKHGKRKQPRHAKMTSEKKTWKKEATTTCKDDVRKKHGKRKQPRHAKMTSEKNMEKGSNHDMQR